MFSEIVKLLSTLAWLYLTLSALKDYIRLLLTVNIDCFNVSKAWLHVIKEFTQSIGKRVNDNNVEPVAGGTLQKK